MKLIDCQIFDIFTPFLGRWQQATGFRANAEADRLAHGNLSRGGRSEILHVFDSVLRQEEGFTLHGGSRPSSDAIVVVADPTGGPS